MCLGNIKVVESKYINDKQALIKNLFPQGELWNRGKAEAVIISPKNKVLSIIPWDYKFADKDKILLQELCECKGNLAEMHSILTKDIEIKKYIQYRNDVKGNQEFYDKIIRSYRTPVEKILLYSVEEVMSKGYLAVIAADSFEPRFYQGRDNSKSFIVEMDRTKNTGKITMKSLDNNFNVEKEIATVCKTYEIYLYNSYFPLLNREVVINGKSYFVPLLKMYTFLNELKYEIK